MKHWEVACCALFASALCAAALPGVRTPQRPPGSAARDVREIVVTHLPDDISTRTQMSLARLRRAPEARRVTLTRPADMRTVLASLANHAPSEVRTYDARWEFVIVRRDTRRTHASCNAFGNVGAYDGLPVHFRLERLVRELKRRYPVLRGVRS